MTDQQSNDLVAIKLDAERRREIDDVKKRMEEFLREQINVTNELKLVVKGQDGLKERFEMGVAKTLKELDHKFDQFMIEWGQKKAEDLSRDKAIIATENKIESVDEKFNKYLAWPIITVCVSILGSLIFYIARHGFR